MISLTLLGQVVLSQDGKPLSQFRSQKEVALLIYLAQTEQAHQRDFLATLLWESSSTKQSLTNLRTVLSRLRKRVGDALLITRKTVALRPENLQQVDSVNLLQTLAGVGQIDTAVKASTLQNTLDSYHGDFLTYFHLPKAPQFNQWARETRQHIRQQVIGAYGKLGQYALSSGDVAHSITVAHRWLQVDAVDEAAHTLLIRLLLRRGNPKEAAAHYAHAAKLLKTELGIEPPAEMTTLIQDALPKPTRITRPAVAVRHNLPAEYDQFFGRKTVQDEIQTRLDQPWCRLVTIVGQGGAGKTRLAITIARSRLAQYPDGVWLVDLTEIDPDDSDMAEAIGIEIATILNLRLSGSATPIEQTLTFLQHKQMLLLLDNFEHLLAGMQIVLDIVQRCEKIQMLVTSREALKIRAEWTIGLTGLGYPTSDTDGMGSDAVDLFVARQAQLQHGMIAADELTAVRTICRMVQGLPLAIELAAALTRHASLGTIADSLSTDKLSGDSLRDRFNGLTTSLHDVPQRHRGLHIVFEMSWRTLTPALQTCLARLSIFRGGFTQTAVSQITEATHHHLTALIEKSLLTYRAESERYTLHPVIRAYAAEKRPFADPTPHKHADYYLTLLAEQTEPLQKTEPQISISLLEPDIDNARRAWQTALADQNAELLTDALTSLSIYYQLRGLAHEGESVMHNTLRTAKKWGAEGVPLATRAGLERARFQNRLGQYRPAMQTIKTMLKLADQCDDRWAEGMAHVWLGESLWRLGKYDTAKEKLTHALDIGHALNATLIIGWCHHQLGIVDDIQSRYDTAHDHLEKACTAWQELENANILSVSLNSLGLVYYHQSDLSSAQHTLEQSLALCNRIGNRHLQAFLLNNLSIITSEQGDYSGAQYYLQLGLELASSTGNLTGQSQLYNNLGRNYRLLGEFDLSLANLEKGLKISRSLGNQYTEATAVLNLARTKSEQGNLEQAISLYNEALALAQQSNLPSIECHVLINMAELFSKNDTKQAQEYSLKAVELAESVKSPDLLARANTTNNKLHMSGVGNEKSLSE